MRAWVLVLLVACGPKPPPIDTSGAWPTIAYDYDATTEAWTRRTNLRDQYQEILELGAVFRSPQWRAAHASRDAFYRRLDGPARDAHTSGRRSRCARTIRRSVTSRRRTSRAFHATKPCSAPT